MPRRDDLAKLRGLAGEAGYTVERAIRRNCWRLVDAKGETVVNPRNGATAFSAVDAMAFLTAAGRPGHPMIARRD